MFTLKQFEKQRVLKDTQIYPNLLLKVVFIYFIFLAWQFPSFVLDGGGYFKIIFFYTLQAYSGKSLCSVSVDFTLM